MGETKSDLEVVARARRGLHGGAVDGVVEVGSAVEENPEGVAGGIGAGGIGGGGLKEVAVKDPAMAAGAEKGLGARVTWTTRSVRAVWVRFVSLPRPGPWQPAYPRSRNFFLSVA